MKDKVFLELIKDAIREGICTVSDTGMVENIPSRIMYDSGRFGDGGGMHLMTNQWMPSDYQIKAELMALAKEREDHEKSLYRNF